MLKFKVGDIVIPQSGFAIDSFNEFNLKHAKVFGFHENNWNILIGVLGGEVWDPDHFINISSPTNLEKLIYDI